MSEAINGLLIKLGLRKPAQTLEPKPTARPIFSEETSKRIVNDEPPPQKPERPVGPRRVPKVEEPKEEWRTYPGSGKIE